MKRYILILSCLLFCLVSQSQSLYTCRYWFDQETEQAEIVTSNSNLWQLEIDAGGLSPGLHMLFLHVKDSTGVWSTPQHFLFYKASLGNPISASDVTYRCWFAQDFEHQQSGSFGTGQFLLDATDLEPGLHMLYMVLEGYGLSSAEHFLFYKASIDNPINASDVTYRCWFDQDIEHQQTGAFGTGQFLLNAADLEPGLHMLYVVLEGYGLSTAEHFLFYKASLDNPISSNDVTYRCWFDQDFEHQQSGSFGTGSFLLDAANIEPGLHMLYMVLEGYGLSSAEHFLFYKASINNPINANDVTYRCWFDQDFENQQSGSFGTGQFLLDVTDLESGLHMLYVVLEGCGMTSAEHFLFYKASAENPVNPDDVVYHYWFDDDVDNMQTGAFDDGNLLLDASDLEDGNHTLYIILEGDCLTTTQSYDFIKNDTLPSFYAITASASPVDGGSISGAGTYLGGETCTLTATPNFGYDFEYWTKNGDVISTSPVYSFIVTESANFIAHFVQQTINTYYVSALVNPSNGGSVSGAGAYNQGSTCTLTATAAEGYFFLNWTHNGNVVSTNPTYSFTVTGNASYVAHFSFGLPELHVTGITHSTFVAGQQATISWTVQNDGTAATPNGALWHDRVWLSVESRVAADDNNPILLGTFDNLSALNPGEYYTQTQTFNIPLEISGEYFLFVLTDAYDCHTIYWDSTGVQIPYSPPPYIGCLSHHCYSCPNVADNRIYEQSEYAHGEGPGGYYNDNFFYTLVDITVPPLPDLQVTSVVAPEDIIGIFNPYTESSVTATIRNMGVNDITNGHWKDKLYMSFDPEGNSAMLIGIHAHSGPLGAGESYQVNEWTSGWETAVSSRDVVTVFYGFMLSGDIRFFVQTDGYDDVYERLENNNIGAANVTYAYLGATGELEPLDLNVPDTVSTGEVFSYSYRVYNNGAGEPYGNNRGSIYYFVDNWWDNIYLCQNADTLDDSAILLKKVHHFGGLQHGTYYSVSESISLPPEITSGNYYLYVLTDADNVVYEYNNEDNNLARSHEITVVQPDLQVTQVLAPEQITTGYPLNISYTLANTGEGSIINRMITDRICISVSGNMTDTVGLASIRRDVYLPSGQSLTVMCNDLAPSNLPGGTYHLIVVTDCGHEINESNEVNNTGSLYPINVAYPPMPDLEPVSLTLPEVIQAGEVIPVQFDVTNVGDLDLLNSNCTFDVYAVMGEEEILCPVQSQTLPLGNYVSIGINETLHFVRTIMIPPTVTSACSTFELMVNKGGLVPELDTTNNVYTATATVLDCPLPDLVVTNISATAIQSGVENQVSFIVNNVGTADFEGSFNTTIYVRSVMDTILCPLVLQVSPEANNYSIPMGGTLSFMQTVLVPPMANASCNLLEIIVDEGNAFLEANDDNNATTIAATVINYPFDLRTTVLQVPDSVWAGEITSLTWTVKNIGTCPSEEIPLYVKKNGTYTLVQSEILPQPWMDKVYVSTDAVLSDDDIELCSVARSTVVQPNGTYTVEQSVTVPYTHLDNQYLLCVSDASHVTYDSDTLNNVKSIPVEVQLGVLPDLHITSLTVEEELTCDRAYWVHYTVVNEGERVTQKENWTDAFYIGEAMTTIGALQLGSKIHYGALEVGESYTDSIEIIIPSGLEGDYFLTGFTDRTEQIYEHDNENDNLLSIPVTVYALDPCDLIAMQPEFPTAVASGGDMAVSWRLNNNGPNPAVGRIRNAVYLSTDATWSSDDMMLGYADMDINIAVNGYLLCQLSGTITGMDEGRYYVIVKTNILNALNETSYENNICGSIFPTEITFPTLAIGETIHRTIEPKRYNYYKIEVGPEYEGQTLLCRMESHEHNLSVANEIYLSHESVPTPMDFDYGVFAPYSYEQEIIIPSLEQGAYYLMVQGAAFHEVDSYIIVTNPRYIDTVAAQNISISTSIVDFEILGINDNHGSNTGSFTTKVTGAKFDNIMDFRLVKGGNYQPAQKTFFSNSTETYVTFNLTDLPLGTYSMEAELPGGVITVKENAFTIEEGLPAELNINIIKPSSVRHGNTFPVTIEFSNVGTTDLNVEGLVVMSRNGHPVGFTSEELLTGQTAVAFFTSEDNGNPGVMRPGYYGAKTILVKATNANDVNLVVYAIRRQN